MIIMMLLVILMLVLTVCIHYCALWYLSFHISKDHPAHLASITIFVLLVLVHVVEILAYAGSLKFAVEFLQAGGFDGDFQPVFRNYFYYSAACYTTVGLTEFYPTDNLKFYSAMESLIGFMMLTWSATFLYSAMDRLWESNSKNKKNE